MIREALVAIVGRWRGRCEKKERGQRNCLAAGRNTSRGIAREGRHSNVHGRPFRLHDDAQDSGRVWEGHGAGSERSGGSGSIVTVILTVGMISQPLKSFSLRGKEFLRGSI